MRAPIQRRAMTPRLAATSIIFLAGILLSACQPPASVVATKIFQAPNLRKQSGVEFQPTVQTIARKAYAKVLDVPVSGATLRVGVIEPGTYRLDWKPRIDGPHVRLAGPVRFEFTRSQRPPLGLVVVLHGFGCGKEQLLPWGFQLANAGYRVAMVDLRGHGASTGKWVGFGALEKNDLRRVLDALEDGKAHPLPVGVLGVSYGAAIGLEFAAVDPRVRTVVALAPFASAASGIMELARALYPDYASHISNQRFRSAFAIGAERGSFSWAETDTAKSVAALDRPVLLIHGSADDWISPENSRRLYRVAEAGSRLLFVPGETHVSLPLHVEAIAAPVCAWFQSELQPPSPATVAEGLIGEKATQPVRAVVTDSAQEYSRWRN